MAASLATGATAVMLSELLEAALEEVVRENERRAWLADNEGAISRYNARVEADGVFSDEWRRF